VASPHRVVDPWIPAQQFTPTVVVGEITTTRTFEIGIAHWSPIAFQRNSSRPPTMLMPPRTR
jgi:hypothetical protein